jgi:ribosomal protein S11
MKKFLENTKSFREKLITSRRVFALKRLRRLYKHKRNILNKNFLDILGNLKGFNLKIFIRVLPNNIFCTLKNLGTKKTLVHRSSGTYKLRTSKKNLKYNVKIMLQFFFKDIKDYFKNEKNVLIEITCGIKIRKQIIKFWKQKIKKKNVILQINEKKCFNGCRPPKKRRKKRTGLRIFK